jgi:hypothetical protein
MVTKKRMLQHLKEVPPGLLPFKGDFGAAKYCLDQICAWKHFGNLDLEEAHALFLKRPDIYQEDFMFMGWKAFVFYFPVIESYLYEVERSDELDQTEAWILGCCIESQFENRSIKKHPDLRERVSKLGEYIRSNLQQFAADSEEKERILIQWKKVEKRVGK